MWVEMRHPVSASPSPNLFVPLRRRELKYLAKAAPWTAAPVRLPKETWIEISIYLRWQWNFMFVSLRRRELKWQIWHKAKLNIRFVSSRRRELKSQDSDGRGWHRIVRLLTETWVEMAPYCDGGEAILFVSVRRRELKFFKIEIFCEAYIVRLLAETWFEMMEQLLRLQCHRFVSLWGCEL